MPAPGGQIILGDEVFQLGGRARHVLEAAGHGRVKAAGEHENVADVVQALGLACGRDRLQPPSLRGIEVAEQQVGLRQPHHDHRGMIGMAGP